MSPWIPYEFVQLFPHSLLSGRSYALDDHRIYHSYPDVILGMLLIIMGAINNYAWTTNSGYLGHTRTDSLPAYLKAVWCGLCQSVPVNSQHQETFGLRYTPVLTMQVFILCSNHTGSSDAYCSLKMIYN